MNDGSGSYVRSDASAAAAAAAMERKRREKRKRLEISLSNHWLFAPCSAYRKVKEKTKMSPRKINSSCRCHYKPLLHHSRKVVISTSNAQPQRALARVVRKSLLLIVASLHHPEARVVAEACTSHCTCCGQQFAPLCARDVTAAATVSWRLSRTAAWLGSYLLKLEKTPSKWRKSP